MADHPDETRTESDFAALWSSDGVTRSFAPTASGLPADLPFLFSAGQNFGPYLIVRPIGKGGMGQVYEAEETESGRRIALKLLSRGLGDDEERERFLREGRLAASLSHPNCVYVFGTSEIQGFPIIAMELVPEGTLKDMVVAGVPMRPAVAVDAILQVIAGLEAAASIGILHRDVKPSNCFVHREGRVLVGDFGLSVATSGHSGSDAGTILGTPGFASPEQLRGGPLDVRSDIYSVGATLFYLLAGRAPFDDRSTTDLMTKVASQPAPSLSSLRSDVPRRLAQAVSRCLAKLPQERYTNYAALAAALAPFSSAQLAHAPIFRRSLSGWIDSNIVAIPTVVAIQLLGLQIYSPSHLGGATAAAAIAVAVMALYYGVLEGHWGAAAGKALFGLRVVDAGNVAPGIGRGIRRALVFAVTAQLVLLVVRMLVLRTEPRFSVRILDTLGAAVYLTALFSIARRSNGFRAAHDRISGTRVVRKRVHIEARQRAERTLVERSTLDSDVRIGPYLVPQSAPVGTARAVTLEGFDDRLHRPVWIEMLPSGSPALSGARRDLDRPARVRWLAGRRLPSECWDAYEAVDGLPIDEAVSRPHSWSSVRHWIDDLVREMTSGLRDGSLPPLTPATIWIGADDRARVVEWQRTGAVLSRIDGGEADLASAQRLIYGVAVAALLGVSVEEAFTRLPDTPLPLSARTLLLALKEAKFTTVAALQDAVSDVLVRPAAHSRARRGGQIAVSASFPLAMAIVAIGGILWIDKNRATMADASEAFGLATWTGLWLVALSSAAGSSVVTVFLSALGALITGSGFTFRPFGATLVNRRGSRASRLRALWRSAVTWTPVLVTLIVVKMSPAPPDYRAGVLALATVMMAAIAAAAVWAVNHPSRSLQDRLAGTWIVPR